MAAALMAMLFLCAPPALAAPEEVTVSSAGGGISLSGQVLGYDGRYLRLQTLYGEVTLDYAAVTCRGATCPDPQAYIPLVRLSGAHRMGEVLLPALIEAFARERDYLLRREDMNERHFSYILARSETEQPLLRLDFRLSTSDEGFADLLANETDLVMSVREIHPHESERAQEIGLGDLAAPGRSRIIALDALVPITSAARDLKTVRLRDLARAYGGEMDNWAALGGGAGPLALHLGNVEAGQVQTIIDAAALAAGQELAPDILYHDSDAALAAAVAGDPRALGLVPYGAGGNAQPLALSTGCGGAIAASPATIKTEDYPLTMPLFLYQPIRRLPPVAEDFLVWLRGTEAQLVVRRAGLIDQEAVPIPLAAQGNRLANAITIAGQEVTLRDLKHLVQALQGKERLSTTFRFEEASSRLDAQSRSNLYHLARAIREGRYRGKDLLLVGFSDGVGPASANLALARERAAAVREQVLDVLGGELPPDMTLEAEAFGEALPLACDTSEWGRRMNRRVELWTGN